MAPTDIEPNTSAAEHTQWVCEAAVETITATCGIELASVEQEGFCEEAGIIGIMPLKGQVTWSVYLALPRETATIMTAKFAGFEIPFESDDMGDAVGELTNIFAGTVKFKLDAKGIKCDISLPSILRAQNISILDKGNAVVTKTRFSSSLGELWAGVIAAVQSD